LTRALLVAASDLAAELGGTILFRSSVERLRAGGVEEIRRAGMSDSVALISFDHRAILRLASLAPEMTRGRLFGRTNADEMLARRGETSTTSDERMTELFEEHLGKVRRLLREDPRFEALEVPYAEVIADPGTQAERIARFVGLPVDVGRMAAAVDPSLYRNRA